VGGAAGVLRVLAAQEGESNVDDQLRAVASQRTQTDRRLTFVGTATTVLRLGSFVLLTDPIFLHRGQRVHLGYGLLSRRRTEPAMQPEELPRLDALVLSHLHGDHFDRIARDRLDRDLPVITTPHAAKRLIRWGFRSTDGINTWRSSELSRGEDRLTVTAVPAQHGPAGVHRLPSDPRTDGTLPVASLRANATEPSSAVTTSFQCVASRGTAVVPRPPRGPMKHRASARPLALLTRRCTSLRTSSINGTPPCCSTTAPAVPAGRRWGLAVVMAARCRWCRSQAWPILACIWSTRAPADDGASDPDDGDGRPEVPVEVFDNPGHGPGCPVSADSGRVLHMGGRRCRLRIS